MTARLLNVCYSPPRKRTFDRMRRLARLLGRARRRAAAARAAWALARNCCGRDGIHKKKGRLRCHKRPKSREETPKEGNDSGGLPHTLVR
jgi:hypothetical protein